MPASRVTPLSNFLTANRHGARYEFAAAGATQAGELIVRDNLPVLVMTTFKGRPLVTPDQLADEVAKGTVRYALIGGTCRVADSTNPACSPTARWVRSHGIDVSAQAAVYGGLVWQLGSDAEKIHALNDRLRERSHQRRAHLIAIARHHLGPVARRRLKREERATRARNIRHHKEEK
jgi:hypothetical protein